MNLDFGDQKSPYLQNIIKKHGIKLDGQVSKDSLLKMLHEHYQVYENPQTFSDWMVKFPEVPKFLEKVTYRQHGHLDLGEKLRFVYIPHCITNARIQDTLNILVGIEKHNQIKREKDKEALQKQSLKDSNEEIKEVIQSPQTSLKKKMIPSTNYTTEKDMKQGDAKDRIALRLKKRRENMRREEEDKNMRDREHFLEQQIQNTTIPQRKNFS